VYDANGKVLYDDIWSSYYVGEPSLVRVGTKKPAAKAAKPKKAAAKKVPDWARGPALREALEAQFNKKQKTDPDSIFPEVRTCDLEDIFKSFQGQEKKKRAYRQRQSTGNWQRDELTSAEKLRYKEDMGYQHCS
jgi:hypothetical protein